MITIALVKEKQTEAEKGLHRFLQVTQWVVMRLNLETSLSAFSGSAQTLRNNNNNNSGSNDNNNNNRPQKAVWFQEN